ncbi:DNA-directed RNA polymerase, mitochondrial isoform X2 [Pseudomyrmex gracilis]|uniref:DNA-directed RNA polymerase, mitochondrial isoform X2 n=1 Tax=Pseudomyrmex gracilis TaxID=219809 RepID=UPI000994944D|nr:DNA-directed RNA polymerase, mitochondrial isoform X2 [Pseudomyrmex gracilis]
MFILLRMRAASIHNRRVVSSTAQHPTRVCSFCNFHHLKPLESIKSIRRYTTDTVELQVSLKKKVKRRSKKYAELLEVKNQETTNTKAAVRKLSSAHMSILADQPDVTLDNLHKIANIRKKSVVTQPGSKKTQKKKSAYIKKELDHVLKESSEYLNDESAVVEELKESGLNDSTTLIKGSTYLNVLQEIDNDGNNETHENVLTQTSRYNKVQSTHVAIPFTMEKDTLEDFISDRYLKFQLLAYIDVYIQSGMSHKALNILTQKKAQLKRGKVLIAEMYNLLLDSYVSHAHLEKAFHIYRLMKTDSVQPNPQTYALMFEMIAKMKNREKQMEGVTELLTDMNAKGISVNKMMDVSHMNTTQRDLILQFIRVTDPEYHVQYTDIDTAYKCRLLKNLTADSNYQSPAKTVVRMDELRDMMRKQIDMEKQCELEVSNIAPITSHPDVRKHAIERITEWERHWRSAVTEAFEKNLFYLKQKEFRQESEWKFLYPFLRVLPKEEYINAILREIRQLAQFSDTYSSSMPNLYTKLGNYIYKKYEFQRKKKAGITKNNLHIYEKYLEWYLQMNPADRTVNGRIKWQQLIQEAKRKGMYSEMMVPEWPRNVTLNVGKFLYNIIVNDVKIPHVFKVDGPERQIPAFYLLFRTKAGNILREEIKPHPHLHRLYKESHPEMLTFETVLLPTLSPPRPWTNINSGGYLFSKTSFVRDPYMTLSYLMKNISNVQLYPAFDCLNQLGSIPWKINEPMLDILIQIFRNGGSEKLNVPQPPSALPSLAELTANNTVKDKNKLSKLALELRRKKNEMYSLWCDCLYKLSIANHFRGKVFWLPHNIDFRGRAYPLPPHLTHLTSDLGRSILMFAEEKPLGPDGLDWLKLHTINITGMKKREPLHKRLEFANEILDLIVDSARNPLTGEMWWTKSDEPWQTLAACKEIDNALRSPDVEKYMSSFPIHQDGSCNGLQHYAALGRDQIGAESVNLYPSDTPQDVYSVVAGIVDHYRQIDAENGVQIARVLKGHISRKVIKQTVMTTVYGVTKFGAKLQIARQLSDLKNFDQNYTWSGSLYLVDKTFQALRSMFTSAKEIQDWFTDCARVISTRCNQYVQWVTPLGLPVLQPYSKRTKPTSQNPKTIKKPDTLKQKNAFPPNFIHSLDSSHMMLTSLHCEQAGITFMSVHDCFWTHPCTVDIMNKICRQQFIALHREPILEDLSKFLCKRYEKHFTVVKQRNDDLSIEVFKKLPRKGDFDINGVLSSKYFFS